MLLEYPPPTILGYALSEESTIIEVVHEHLQENKAIQDDDLVLIVDGYRAWFQLPASVLVQQYEAVLEDANERLQEKYGAIHPYGRNKEPRPLFRQTVLWAADEHCWRKSNGDRACTAVPESPFFWDQSPYANASDEASAYNPKFINSGTVIGPAKDLRAIFSALMDRSATPYGRQGLQHTLQTLFSEQEQARELIRRYNLGVTGRVREWWYGLNPSERPLRKTNISIAPGKTFEYAMGLDYNSTLFQSMSPPHSFNGDIDFIKSDSQPRDTYDSAYTTVNPKTGVRTYYSSNPNAVEHIPLPDALANQPSPYQMPEKDAHVDAIPANVATGLSITKDLDDLPPAAKNPWFSLSLAHNMRSRTVPAALHFPSFESVRFARSPDSATDNSTSDDDTGDSGDSLQYLDPRDQLWSSLWFHANARALLRRFLRQSTVKTYEDEVEATETESHERWWRNDERGGKGGVWTEDGEWLAWGDVCAGFEDEVFGDGKGVWLGEEGNVAPIPVGDAVGDDGMVVSGEEWGLEGEDEIPPAEVDRVGKVEAAKGSYKGEIVDADGDFEGGGKGKEKSKGGAAAAAEEEDNDDGLLDFVGEVWDEIKGAEKDQVENMDDVLRQIDEEMTERLV